MADDTEHEHSRTHRKNLSRMNNAPESRLIMVRTVTGKNLNANDMAIVEKLKEELTKMPPKKYFVYSPGNKSHWLCYGVDTHNVDMMEEFASEPQAKSIADELNTIKKPNVKKLNNLIQLIRGTLLV